MKDFIKKHLNLFIIIGVYILLTLILTTPVIFNINTHIAGDGADGIQILANSFRNANYIHSDSVFESASKFFKHYVFSLKVFNFYTHHLILHLVFGEPLAYNIIWLSSFFLAAIGAYCLINYLTKNKVAAFISGIIYSFSPTHFAFALGFGGSIHIEWIPFFTLYFLKYFRKPSLKNGLLTVIFFLFIIVNEPHFAAYILIFIVLISTYKIIFFKNLLKNKKIILYSLSFGIISIVLLLWHFLPLIKVTMSGENYLEMGFDNLIRRSTDLAGFFVPFFEHPIWGSFFSSNISEKITQYPPFNKPYAEITNYIGFTVLFFSLYALIGYKKNKTVLFWLTSFILFSVLSLGPFLHFLGLIEPRIPMPYLLFYKYIPFFNNIRGVGRIFIFSVISFSILTGFGIKYFLKKYNKNSKNKLLVPLIIFVIILIEFWSVPKMSNIEIPAFYKNLKEESGRFSIIQIPIATSYNFASRAGYYNATHNKKVLGGVDFARKIPGHWDFERNTPVISELLYSLPDVGSYKQDIINHPFSEISTSILNKYNVKYLILHKDMAGFKELSLKNFIFSKNFIEDNIKTTKIFEDNKTLVYQVLKEEKNNYPYFIKLDDSNWSEISKDKNNNIVRWAKNDAKLKLVNLSKEKQNFHVEFNVKSEEELRRLNILLGDENIDSYIVLPKENKITLNLENVEPGENSLKFQLFNESNNVINKESDESGILVFDISYFLIDSNANNKGNNLNIFSDRKESKLLQIPIYIDNKNIIEGYDGNSILKYQNFIKENNLWGNNLPFIKELLFAEKIKEQDDMPYDIINKKYYYEIISQIAKYYDIKHILLNKDYISEKNLENYRKFIEENLNIDSKQEDNKHMIYKIGDIKEIKPIISIQDNWKFLYKSNPNFQTREMFNDASLVLINSDSSERDIKFIFKAFSCEKDEPRKLEIYLNNNLVETISLERKHKIYEIILPKVKYGDNDVVLKLYDKNGQYIDTENDRNICTAKFTNLEAEFN